MLYNRIVILILFFSFYLSYSQSNDFFNPSQEDLNKVDSLYAQMSLEEKIGQLFVYAAYSNRDDIHQKEIEDLIKNYHIGGLIFMQDNAEKQYDLTKRYQSLSKIPLLIGIDGEWGLSMRLKNTIKYPYNMALGAIQNDSLIYALGVKIAKDCQTMGINWNFAPAIDVNTNPANPIIGNRSFGSSVENVSKKGWQYTKGLQDAFVLSSAKHFPGHGDTDKDSHHTLPVILHSQARMDSIELAPFKALIKNGVTGVMVSHLDVPIFQKNNIPATLSKPIVTDLLKKELGFKGLIITDALNMQGVAAKYPVGEVEVLAFLAGNDVLLFPQNIPLATESIKNAVTNKTISEERLAESVKKILWAKLWSRQFKTVLPDKQDLYALINDSIGYKLRHNLYTSAITVAQKKSLLTKDLRKKTGFIALEGDNFQIFKDKLDQYSAIHMINKQEVMNIENVLPPGTPIIVGCFFDTSTAYKSYKLSNESQKIISELSKNYPIHLVLLTSPYSLKILNLSNFESIVIGYENNEITQGIIPEILFQTKKAKGKLPIKL